MNEVKLAATKLQLKNQLKAMFFSHKLLWQTAEPNQIIYCYEVQSKNGKPGEKMIYVVRESSIEAYLNLSIQEY